MKNTEKYVFMVPVRDRESKTNKKLTKLEARVSLVFYSYLGLWKVIHYLWFILTVDHADVFVLIDIQLYAVDPDRSIIHPNDRGFVDTFYNIDCSVT